MLARTGDQIGAGKLLLERATVHVGMAGDGQAALEQAHDHGVGHAQHILRAGRAFRGHEIQGRMHVQNAEKIPARMMVEPLGEHARGKGCGLPVLRHQTGAGSINQTQGNG